MKEITKLLRAWSAGDQEALDQLVPLVDPELRKIARKYMRNEKSDHVLQTTALVHEALMKLIKEDVAWEDRKQFYVFVAKRMRQVLVDYARKQSKAEHIDISEAVIPDERSREVLLLDAALTKLNQKHKRQALVVECRHFIGLTIPEVAKVLGIGTKTVERDWDFARDWLKHEMGASSDLRRQ